MSYSLFSVFGVEIEYAVVRKDTLSVDASVDRLIEALAGNPDAHPVFGNVEADNELAAHVLELKCLKPAVDMAAQAGDFAAAIKLVNGALGRWNARLMPGGMHPFMDPAKESQLWAHEDRRVYEMYDRIFDCRGHGWFNIQSVHLNLPFANDGEFARLHNAVSLLLPVLPALAASSPVYDGRHGGWLDGRLFHYVGNQRRLPSIIGGIVPEPIGSEEEYREKILAPMYRDIAPFDPEGLMEEEWLNSRAAIARFDRGSIEIRCLDTQERPLADLALCHWVISVLRTMLDTGVDLLAAHRKVPAGLLKALFLDSARYGMAARIPEGFPRAVFGLPEKPGSPGSQGLETVGEFLRALTPRAYGSGSRPEAIKAADSVFAPALGIILSQGNLAERIMGAAPKPKLYPDVYRRLCDCLEADEPFTGLPFTC